MMWSLQSMGGARGWNPSSRKFSLGILVCFVAIGPVKASEGLAGEHAIVQWLEDYQKAYRENRDTLLWRFDLTVVTESIHPPEHVYQNGTDHYIDSDRVFENSVPRRIPVEYDADFDAYIERRTRLTKYAIHGQESMVMFEMEGGDQVWSMSRGRGFHHFIVRQLADGRIEYRINDQAQGIPRHLANPIAHISETLNVETLQSSNAKVIEDEQQVSLEIIFGDGSREFRWGAAEDDGRLLLERMAMKANGTILREEIFGPYQRVEGFDFPLSKVTVGYHDDGSLQFIATRKYSNVGIEYPAEDFQFEISHPVYYEMKEKGLRRLVVEAEE